MAGEEPEFRLGLVLYGGVSLAVYIYGVVLEVQRLLRAAGELEGDAPEQSAYARALSASGASGVSVDIVSGTSAGGINGILLAKALARGTDVGSVRELWVKDGDIGALLQPKKVRDPKSLLQSTYFEERLAEGMERLDAAPSDAPPAPPILDLFVSSTNLRGGARRFSDSLGREIDTRQHRYVFQLKLRSETPGPLGTQGYEHDDFLDNDRLVKLARATSAFPVAFEPVRIGEGDKLLDPADRPGGWFADGGILNNKPFSEAIDAIFSRASDRPVRRWLLSIDPDPVLVPDESEIGEQPAFDRIAASSIASIPRYQSIARDLGSLLAHNERVEAVASVVFALEAEIATAPPGEAGDGAPAGDPLGTGPTAAYQVMRRQAWELEIADQLMAAVREEDVPDPLDRATLHQEFRGFAAEAIAREASAEGSEWDLAFQLRRVYYLIKLIAMADGVEAGNVRAAREALWAEFEAVSAALWEQLADPELGRSRWLPPEREQGRRPLAGDEGTEVVSAFRAVAAESTARLREALAGVVLLLSPPGRTAGEGRGVAVSLAGALEDFERRDASLLAAQVYDGLRRRDRVDHAQISPTAASNTTVPPASKLAGDSIHHFGGFLDRGWRENDLMWGRLDGAEVLMRAVLDKYEGDDKQELIDAVQEEILRDELPEVLAGPEPWKEKLTARVGEGPSPSDLDGRDLAATGLHATAVMRRMLLAAGKAADEGTLLAKARAKALRFAAKGLGLLLSLAYLPAKLFRLS